MRVVPVLAMLGCAMCSSGTPVQREHDVVESDSPQTQPDGDPVPALAGRIWDVAQARFVSQATLFAGVRAAEVVLIGEDRNNPDHHPPELAILEAMIEAGRTPAIVLDEVYGYRQPDIDRALASGGDASKLVLAVNGPVAQLDYPPRIPLFERAVARKLPILAAALDDRIAQDIWAGKAVFGPAFVRRFGLDQPLAQEVRLEMGKCYRSHRHHCIDASRTPPSNAEEERDLDALVGVKRARYAHLAQLVATASKAARSALVIADPDRVRSDHGAPAAMQRAFGLPSLAIALLEAEPGASPADYAKDFDHRLPFAYLWFTPHIDRTPLRAAPSSPASEESGFVLDSVPTGARVLVDGRDLGHRTPARVTGPAAGPHRIQLEVEGYPRWEQVFEVTAGVIVKVPTALIAR